MIIIIMIIIIMVIIVMVVIVMVIIIMSRICLAQNYRKFQCASHAPLEFMVRNCRD